MKKYLLYLVAISFAVLLISTRATKPVSARGQRPQFASGQLLVKYKSEVEEPEIERDIADRMLPSSRAGILPLHTNALGKFYLVKLQQGVSVEDAASILSQSPNVEYAEPNYLVYPTETTPNDPFFPQEWGMLNTGTEPPGGKAGADINAPRAWDITTGGDVVVATTDTGVDPNHEDLAANIWVNPNEIPGNGIDDDGNGYIDDINGWNFFDNNNQVFDPVNDQGAGGHGTHVSGTIGAVGNNGKGVAGVAWQVKLMILKFIGRQPDGSFTGSTSDAISAINYAIGERKRGINVRVINASWAGPKNAQALHDAIDAAGKAGILFVCAAGNADTGQGQDDGDPNFALYPAAWSDIPTLMSVAALDDQDNLAFFSYFGHQTVAVGAPGVGIMSTLPNNTYGQNTGTSMATPHVAGVAVLLAAHEPSLTPAQIAQRIISTSQPVLSLASKVIGSGRVDAYNALTNQVADPGSPQIAAVTTNKKWITVDGIGFINGSAVVEANGVGLGNAVYDSSFVLSNGTITELSVKLGKPLMRSTFPPGVPVPITVFNPTTGERSAPFTYTK